MKPTKSKVVSLIFLCLVWATFSQNSKEFEDYKLQYPNSNLVRLNQKTVIIIGLIKDKVSVKQEFLEEDLYLGDNANSNSKNAINFSSFFQLEKVEASSFTFIDGSYKEFKVEEFKEKDDLKQSFYSDTKSLNFIFPNLKKGSKTLIEYSEIVKNPRFLSTLYFGDYFPIINNKVIIIADKNVNLKFQKFNTQGIDLELTKKVKRNNIIYTWEVKGINKYEYEENAPTFKKILPHIVPIITSYQVNDKKIDLATEIGDLYQWYYSLVKDINTGQADHELKKLVDQLTENKPNDLEKVRAIYYWTQKHIKYIAFEYALGGFIPRQANDVYKKKYGDCKDNSSILYQMLELAGIKGNLTWIGTRSIPYSYEEVTTPKVDNHMILSYDYEGNTYFLDATGRYIPLDFPTSFIQGKEALIANGATDFIIKNVPIVPAINNAVIDTTTISIEEENILGISNTEISGYQKIDFFNYLEREKTEDQIKEFYNSELQKGNNKFLIDSIVEINKYDYDKTFKLKYNFRLNDYAKKLGDELYVNLNLNKDLSLFKTKDDRINDVEFDYKSHYNYTTILEIPKGYNIDYIPENVMFSNGFITSEISYLVDNDRIIYKHVTNMDFLSLDTKQQKEVNSLIKETEKAYKEVVILKKPE